MDRIIAGMGSSHAATVAEPSEWDKGRAANRANYKRRYGVEPAVHPKALEETMEVRERRYSRIREGLEFLRGKLREKRPDALILVGDDQDENFTEENWPQVAIYLGEEVFSTRRREGKKERGARYRVMSADYKSGEVLSCGSGDQGDHSGALFGGAGGGICFWGHFSFSGGFSVAVLQGAIYLWFYQ